MNRTSLLYLGFVCIVVVAVTSWIVLGSTTPNRSYAVSGPAPTSATEGEVLTFATVMALPTDIGVELTPVSEAQPDDSATSEPVNVDGQSAPLPEPTTSGSADFVPSDNPSGAEIVLAEPTAAASAETGFVEYTIQRGDVLGKIAADYGVSVSDILAANAFDNPDSLTVGSVIRIPKAP